MLLNRIVSQMYEQVVLLCYVIGLSTHAYVAFFKEVALVFRRDHDPQSDIEFAFTDQERSLDVLLQDKDIALDIACVDRLLGLALGGCLIDLGG